MLQFLYIQQQSFKNNFYYFNQLSHKYQMRKHNKKAYKNKKITKCLGDNKVLTANQKEDQHYIGHYHQADQQMKDNEAITHGYRINFNTHSKILQSIFMLHNQTANIWSHLIPSFISFFMMITVVITITQSLILNNFFQQQTAFTQQFHNYVENLNNITNTANGNFVLRILNEEQYQQKIQKIYESSRKVRELLSELKMLQKDEILNSMMVDLLKIEQVLQKIDQQHSEYFVTKFNMTGLETLNKFIQSQLYSLSSQIEIKRLQLQNHIQDQHIDQLEAIKLPKWPIAVFFFTNSICLLCSALFHLFYPMNRKYFKIFSRLDYSGIVCNLIGGGIASEYYCFYCNPGAWAFYTTICAIGGITIFFLTLTDWFHQPKIRPFKFFCYLGYGAHYFVALAHLLINQFVFDNYGDKFRASDGLFGVAGQTFFFFVGFAIYWNKCPQRHYPGKFNTCGHSHQIFHCFVVIGMYSAYQTVTAFYQSRYSSLTCPISSL